jgi:hypothetical protein
VGLGYFRLALRFAFFAGFFFAAFFFAAMCAPFALRRLSIVPPGAVATSGAAGSFVIQRRAHALTLRALGQGLLLDSRVIARVACAQLESQHGTMITTAAHCDRSGARADESANRGT